MGNRSNNTVADNPGGDKSRSDPVGTDTMGGARVVGNSSDRGSESLRLGDAPVLPLKGLDHRLVGHLASANSDGRGNSNGRSDSSVSNTSNETGASSNASDETVASNSSNETGSSNKASHCTVASEEL